MFTPTLHFERQCASFLLNIHIYVSIHIYIYILYFVHLGDMDRRIFYSLHNIERKQARIKCRILFLEKCESNNIVPYGLQICRKPVLGKSS